METLVSLGHTRSHYIFISTSAHVKTRYLGPFTQKYFILELRNPEIIKSQKKLIIGRRYKDNKVIVLPNQRVRYLITKTKKS